MRKIVLMIAAALALVSCNPEIRSARGLAKRILGEKVSAVRFELLEDTQKDTYELETVGSKVVIRGNNANSMAVGLNRYLQEYCLANVSWYDYNPVELPQTMPSVPSKIRVEAAVPQRFFLNYCTFGYTMPWWNWDQWERFIDWMALNGVNMPLAITGQETLKFIENNTRLLMTLSERLKAKPEELLTRAEARTSEIRELRSELEKFRGREMLSNAESFLASSKKVGPLHVFTGVVPVDTPDNLRKIGDFLRDKDESIVAVLAAVRDGKITFHSVCGKAAVAAGVRAGDIIRSVTAICGGKGGGKPDSAMGGGSDPLKVDDALAIVDDFVSERLK